VKKTARTNINTLLDSGVDNFVLQVRQFLPHFIHLVPTVGTGRYVPTGTGTAVVDVNKEGALLVRNAKFKKKSSCQRNL